MDHLHTIDREAVKMSHIYLEWAGMNWGYLSSQDTELCSFEELHSLRSLDLKKKKVGGYPSIFGYSQQQKK